MRYFEIASGLRLPVSSEEQELLDRAAKPLPEAELDERGQEVARLMVSRGLLDRVKTKRGMAVRASSVKDIWRAR